MTSWSVNPVGGIWFTLGVALLLAIAMFAISVSKRLSTRQRRILITLRTLTAILLVLVMLRPMLVLSEIRKLPGSLIVLADSSRSMQIDDAAGNETRWESLRTTLSQSAEQFNTLAESWDLKFYRFDDVIAPVNFADGEFDFPEEPEGSQTAIGAAISDVLQRESMQRIVAVLLMSDGAQRAFPPRDEPPQAAVDRLSTDQIPLYTFTFGKPSLGMQSDLRVDDLLVSGVVFAETPVTVQAMVSADGYANQTVRVQLLWENAEGEMEVVDTRQLQIDSSRRQMPISLTHTPSDAGEFKIAVEVESPPGELITSNNIQSTFVTVTEGGINVLYLTGAQRIGGGPGIEPRFVRNALSAHSDINLRYDMTNYRRQRVDARQQVRDGNYDVFLIGNVDVNAFDDATWQAIAEEVENGRGLAMLGGFHSFGPGGFRGSPLENVLPITMGRAERQNFGEPPRADMHLPGPLEMRPVPLGDRLHPILQIDDVADPVAEWQSLAPLDGANRFDPAGIKSNAQVIAETPDARRSPLMVVGAWGDGRTAAVAFDSTWRWQMGGNRELQQRFWRQLVLWLASKDDIEGDSVWVRLDQRRYQRGSRVEFTLGALDQDREPIDTATFEIQVELPNGERAAGSSFRRGGELVGNFEETSDPGDYRVVVTGRDNQEVLGTAQARFTVPDRDMELEHPAAEPTFMASLASLTSAYGGEGLAPEELPELLRKLEQRTSEFEEEVSEQQSLWDSWPVLLTLVSLLGTEWWLRKRWGLV